MFEKLERVWDTGATTPYEKPPQMDRDYYYGSYYSDFKKRTGATRTASLRWQYRGVDYTWPNASSTLLLDKTGLVVPEGEEFKGGHHRLIVINPDCSTRCELTVPRIDERSKPEQGYLELPPADCRLEGIEWGLMCHDGYLRYLLEFDWHTGKLLRYAATPLPWM